MKILLAEDELELSRALSAILKYKGYEVDAVYDGDAAVKSAEKNHYDCMIFDYMMPKMDGFNALKIIRDKGDFTPIIMLTAKAELEDRVKGLEAGADDYVTKPFATEELLARIKSLTRRGTEYRPRYLVAGSVTLDIGNQELKGANSIRLSARETHLMRLLMENVGKELTTEEIFSSIWMDDADARPELVWLYISYLRDKLLAVKADIKILGDEGGSFSLLVGEEETGV
jgi:DNA-binding response OmpR family regulator